jgi:hypothetical protein
VRERCRDDEEGGTTAPARGGGYGGRGGAHRDPEAGSLPRRPLTVRSLVAILLSGLLALAAAVTIPDAGASAAAGGAGDLPRVTVIGDSVATGIAYNAAARDVLAEGIDLRLELSPCRRVDGVSCPYDGVIPPNVADLAQSLGPLLGPTVIVAVGYNDHESEYERNIETALAAFRKVGVETVLWATLRAERRSYVRMNETIEAVAARHREMTVIEWNVHSRSHPDWFQPDGLHLAHDGAVAMATLFHTALERLGIPVEPLPVPPGRHRPLQVATEALPAAVSGGRYAIQLRARGGRAPYRWRRGVTFPPWLAISSTGRVTGIVRAKRGAAVGLTVRVTDASRTSASTRLTLLVQGRP